VPLSHLLETARGLAHKLAGEATRGFGLTKRALNATWSATLAEQLETEAECMREAGQTADYAEGVAAFLAKRKPVYTGS
jgi:2-(1,2-epoxy-1,2-dihydrophenyl)acetyl-CoA isomerase